MRSFALIIAPIATMSMLAACSGSTADVGASDGGSSGDASTDASTDTTPSVTADQAAGDAATALCARYVACAPLYIEVYGGQAACVTRLKQSVLTAFAAPSTSTTTAQIEACAQALPATSCADLLSRNTPSICRAVAGTLADGAACSTDGQCVGARCRTPKDQTCGVCGAPAADGAACAVDDDCAPGLTCAANMMCAKIGASTDACDANHPCRADLVCTNGTCNARKAAGQMCTSGVDECDNLNAAICNAQAGVCQTVTFAATGAMCGLVNGALVSCAGAGAMCKGIMAPTYQGTCIAGAADGAACDETNGPNCMPPAVCSSGSCKLVDPTTCK